MSEYIERHFADYNFTFCLLKHSVVISTLSASKSKVSFFQRLDGPISSKNFMKIK